MPKIGFDIISLTDAQAKIVGETETEITLNAVIAREMVQPYEDGKAYKSAEELEKSAWTAEGRWIIALEHPATGLLTRREDISGRMSNIKFVKDLIDDKTKRPMIRGIRADLTWFKDKTPKFVIDALHDHSMKDVSIGFTYEQDDTPGEFNGEQYDFIQRNIFIDHLCAPTEIGRCPSPLCGIGVDSLVQRKIAGDPWEETEQYIRSGHGDPSALDPDSMRTINITEGIKAVVGCPKGKYSGGKCTVGIVVQSFLFSKEKFTMAEAKAWFKAHNKDAVEVSDIPETPCQIKAKFKELGEEGFIKVLKERLSNEELSRLLAPATTAPTSKPTPLSVGQVAAPTPGTSEASKTAALPAQGPAVAESVVAPNSLTTAPPPSPPNVDEVLALSEKVLERAKRLNP